MTTTAHRWLPWVAMLAVLAVTFGIGGWPHGAPSLAKREAALASTIRCPTCGGQSVAASDAVAAKAIRVQIADRLRRGQSDDQIRDFLVSRYDEGLMLEPSRSGVAGLVWAIPVVVAVIAFAAIGLRFRRWRPSAGHPVSAGDQALVDAARQRPPGPGRFPS